jgi:hypothetical protein
MWIGKVGCRLLRSALCLAINCPATFFGQAHVFQKFSSWRCKARQACHGLFGCLGCTCKSLFGGAKSALSAMNEGMIKAVVGSVLSNAEKQWHRSCRSPKILRIICLKDPSFKRHFLACMFLAEFGQRYWLRGVPVITMSMFLDSSACLADWLAGELWNRVLEMVIVVSISFCSLQNAMG